MFRVGDKIVYPLHGAGIIDAVETKEILGEEKIYFILKMPIGNMKISIPQNNINKMNIREVIPKEEGDEVLKILNGPSSEINQNWNQRYRENQEILKTGDIFKIAEIVRDLSAFDEHKGLSTTEKKLLNQAKRIVISELVLADSISSEDAEKLLNEACGM
ncbi:MAG: CarD family transcriptional regulator [Peptoniphilaceae bacterium]|nr:CarD family transcriptional regulator [Peptoniphilaceae bacterium]MDD7382759.1 CarD family transcriptional regulator [Peptoniphilaceae bacterium]MDY3737915.1 CarD family transcriptional regulator [Peptoniphilaceae bacterium]